MKYLLLALAAAYLPAQELADREQMLLDRIEKLERRLAALEKNLERPGEKGAAVPVSYTHLTLPTSDLV